MSIDTGSLYEAHITVPLAHKGVAEMVAQKRGWKLSQIDGDPVLGKGVNVYLTAHNNSLGRIRQNMELTCAELRDLECEVTRHKLELILVDSKTGRF